MQEAQGSAPELVDIKALLELTPAEPDTALKFTAPLFMAMVLASGPIPASEDMVIAPWAADSVTDYSHNTPVQDTTQYTALDMDLVMDTASGALVALEPAASKPEVHNALWPPVGLQAAAVQGLVHHPPVPEGSDAWTSLL